MTHKWDGLLSNEHWYNGHLKFFALWEWTQKVKEATFGDLKHALIHVKEDPHILCKVSLIQNRANIHVDSHFVDNTNIIILTFLSRR